MLVVFGDRTTELFVNDSRLGDDDDVDGDTDDDDVDDICLLLLVVFGEIPINLLFGDNFDAFLELFIVDIVIS